MATGEHDRLHAHVRSGATAYEDRGRAVRTAAAGAPLHERDVGLVATGALRDRPSQEHPRADEPLTVGEHAEPCAPLACRVVQHLVVVRDRGDVRPPDEDRSGHDAMLALIACVA